MTLNNVAINNSFGYGAAWLQCNAQVSPENVTFSNNKAGNVFYTLQAYPPDFE
jgi:hypothetical protein